MVDSHIHTHFSDDSKQDPEGICLAAIEKGLAGIAITDHLTLRLPDPVEPIRQSVKKTQELAEKYRGRLRVFTGVELEEMHANPTIAQEVLLLADYDVVLNSCHKVTYGEWDDYYSFISFDESVSEETIHGFLAAYFEEVYHNALEGDYDVLCHLTCPLRYVIGRYHRDVSLERYSEVIDRILRTVIETGHSLEVNTSSVSEENVATVPDASVLRRYFELGGRRITLAGDSHVAERVGNGFRETIELVKSIGFTGVTHYEKRQPIFESWEIAERGLKL